jgi:hypothetical protein
VRRPFTALVTFLSVFVALAALEGSARATTITFDNLTDYGYGTLINNGYEGLDWNNFYVMNTTDYYENTGANGYTNGTASAPNVAYNGFGYPASISSSTPFTFNSAYFNAAWNNGLSITLTGLLNGVAEDSATFQVNATGSATLETFNWTDINELDFSSAGGTPAGYNNGDGAIFTLDNLTINGAVAAPEPSALSLTGLGFILLLMAGIVVRHKPALSPSHWSR